MACMSAPGWLMATPRLAGVPRPGSEWDRIARGLAQSFAFDMHSLPALSDAAQALGCREGTVKSRVHRAKDLLREDLHDYWTGGSK